ncbi:hypothetical protein, variant [Cryptococcus amylolentus CBS 6039]|uniref:Glucosidase II beta subunit N-terminal domain-containing protein n=1 Tax=Cryptococcus amylolentus CBS 6039 TaxID=1295533 RepID=A0A1E3HBY0_9TREE|nr:hypothetical protein, variant [Cryptococcus amylolentus CBS 6039]ODN73840.1 hypothetical protein, variant [Cryptococcus amylolentus CBS 6039]
MNDRGTLALLYLLLLAPFSLAAEEQKVLVPSQIRGLNPSLYDKYEPTTSGLFHCLDGSKTIPSAAINDDYCDCPDGSDEPGTAACSVGFFWCKNEGHIPGNVLKSRVNDGLCEPDCCDGSDEWATGACPNRCEEVGKEYREAKSKADKLRKTGSKIRNTYIKWAQGEKQRLQEELDEKRKAISAKEVEVTIARAALDKASAQSHEDLERKKQSPVYNSLLSHRSALTKLRTKTKTLETEIEALHSLLREMAKGYNPNYQDMAVKAAVVGYEELTGIKYREGESEEGEVKKEEKPEATQEEITEKELQDLDKIDLDGLLLSDTTGAAAEGDEDEEDGLLWKIDEYIPDNFYDSWQTIRDLAIEWSVRLGLAGKPKNKGNGVDGPRKSQFPLTPLIIDDRGRCCPREAQAVGDRACQAPERHSFQRGYSQKHGVALWCRGRVEEARWDLRRAGDRGLHLRALLLWQGYPKEQQGRILQPPR